MTEEANADAAEPIIFKLGLGNVIVGHQVDLGGLPSIVLGYLSEAQAIGSSPTEEAVQEALRHQPVVIQFTSADAMIGLLDRMKMLVEDIEKAQAV